MMRASLKLYTARMAPTSLSPEECVMKESKSIKRTVNPRDAAPKATGNPAAIAKKQGNAANLKPRPAKYADEQKITILVKENPKRVGTKAWDKFEAYEGAKTVGEYLAKGIGGRSTLSYDVEHEYIKIA